MAVFFTITSFLAALLLFSIQPMVARLMLPSLGGSPSVWNTAMVFFQAVLLGGYLYSHAVGKKLHRPGRKVLLVHALVLLLPLFFLPIALPAGLEPPSTAQPIIWLLLLLGTCVGIPFFVVATSSPLLQRLFALTGHRDAHDPYFLYAASNAGSLIALLAYPFFIEPNLALSTQTRIWAAAYLVLVLCLWGCVAIGWRAPAQKAESATAEALPEAEAEAGSAAELPATLSRQGRITWSRRIRWILLAFVPSSMMLSVTTYLSTDVVAIPLMWIVPLSLYLLSFMVVFAQRQWVPATVWARGLVLLILPLAIALGTRASDPLALLIPMHLVVFFVAAVVCHGAMARDRPPVSGLTEFYGWMALGGVLGGIFNALLAPVLFSDVLEYFITLVLLGFMLPRELLLDAGQGERETLLSPRRLLTMDLLVPAALGALTIFFIFLTSQMKTDNQLLVNALCLGIPAMLCFPLSRRPRRFGLALAAFLGAAVFLGPDFRGTLLDAKRSFFGIHRVVLTADKKFVLLSHGSTIHGVQSYQGNREPAAYYSRQGPAYDMLQLVQSRRGKNLRVAVIGLGCGAMAGHIQPGEDWTFYEIDPYVVEIAQNPQLFTYWSGAPQPPGLVVGDARLKLRDAAPGAYDLILLDAYSSDTIPVHLITQEAFAMYRKKLAPGGIIGWHISNSWFDLEPIIAKLTQDAGWHGSIRRQNSVSEELRERWVQPSQWCAVAADAATLAPLGNLRQLHPWKPLQAEASTPLWTDDRSSLWSIWRGGKAPQE